MQGQLLVLATGYMKGGSLKEALVNVYVRHQLKWHARSVRLPDMLIACWASAASG